MKKNEFYNNKINGVIFDIDGVLVDTEYFQWQGWIEVLKPFNKSVSKKEYLKYAGKRGDIIENEMIKDFSLDIKKGKLISAKEKYLINYFHNHDLKLMPYAIDLLKFFSSKNLILAAASGGPKEESILKLRKTGLLPYFEFVTGGDEIKRGKPFPDIYLHAVKLLKIDPSKCLAIEDTQYGLESAKSAGLKCFAVPNEFSQKQDFSKADAVLKSLREIHKIDSSLF